MIKTAKEAMAHFLGWDLPELKEYQYHSGRTSVPVYTCDNYYYCATKEKQKPAKYFSRGTDQSTQWDWREMTEPYINSFGWHIWKAN